MSKSNPNFIFDRLRKSTKLHFVVSIVVFIVTVALVNKIHYRLDLTEEKKHTFSEDTLNVLRGLKSSVLINFYVNESENVMPTELRRYASRVKQFLNRLEQAADGKVQLRILNPTPNSKAEASAKIDEIKGLPLSADTSIYFGLSVNSLENKKAIPFLNPDKEGQLEYDILKLIHRVSVSTKKKIGIFTNHKTFRGTKDYPEWYFLKQLEEEYQLYLIDSDNTHVIEKNTDLLIVMHPQDPPQKFQEEIESYLHSGGHMMLFVDPNALVQPVHGVRLTVENNLSAWPKMMASLGLEHKSNFVVIDPVLQTEVEQGTEINNLPWALTLSQNCINQQHSLTKGLANIHLPSTGGLSVKENHKMKITKLMLSSPDAFLTHTDKVSDTAGTPEGHQLGDIKEKGGYILAALVEGKFPSLSNNQGEDKEDRKKCRVIVFTDTDFLSDPFIGQVSKVQGRETLTPVNNNFYLVQSSVEYLTDSEHFRNLRSKTIKFRPLTKIAEKEVEVEKEYQEKIDSIKTQIEGLEKQLASVKDMRLAKKEEFMEDPEKAKEIEAKYELLHDQMRSLKYRKRIEVERVQSKVEWLNMAFMPSFIIFCSSVVLSRRKMRTSVR